MKHSDARWWWAISIGGENATIPAAPHRLRRPRDLRVIPHHRIRLGHSGLYPAGAEDASSTRLLGRRSNVIAYRKT